MDKSTTTPAATTTRPARSRYGPYGEQPATGGWSGSRFSYTGQIMLPEVQLYHYMARVYDPSLGRFLQTDPIGYEDVYWKPVWHMLEESFELVLANVQHIRNVPGRKTHVNDATWIADLLAHGLVRSSFVPPMPIQELRDLTRSRKQLVREPRNITCVSKRRWSTPI